MSALIARLESRALVRIVGPDRASWLQGLITQNALELATGELRFGALLTPQGRLLFDLFLGEDEGAILLDVATGRREALMTRLAMYRLRADVQIKADERPVNVLWTEGDDQIVHPGEPWRRDPRLPQLGFRAWGEVPGANASEAEFNAHALRLGAPDPARDAVADQTWPIEADFDLLHGIDFSKGCFVGQETTSRMKRRGQIRSRMLPIVFDGPPPPRGAEILAGDLRAGEVLEGLQGRAMALVRLDRIEGAALSVDGRPVQADPPTWLPLG